VLVINCPTAMVSNAGAAEAVAAAAGRRKHFPILTSWVGAASMDEARRRFAAKRIPSYETPEQAVRGFMYLVNHRRRQDNLMETPPSVPEEFSPDTDRAKDIVARARDEKRAWLTEPEAKEILAAYGIPTVHTHAAATPEEAASAAADVGGSVALKIVSPDIVHKSDVGGVILDLAGPASVFEAAKAMESAVRVKQPDARLWGFSVQPMVHRPGAYELIVGAHEDKNFGPVILFGHGGTAAEIVDDTALGLPPLNLNLANEMISRTRIARLLAGHRNLPRVNLEAIALTLMKLAQLIIDLGEIAEVDINPLLADSFGVTALDARIRVQRPPKSPADRLVIRPYPSELEEPIRIDGVPELILRPIRPEDEPALQNAFSKLTPEEIRLRFLVPIKVMSHVMAARFTQLDYDREMALILAAPGIPGKAEIFGVIRISADPDNERAEYAIIVRHELAGRGLGTMMMTRMLDYARRKGIKEIYGDVLSENHTMLRICKEFGFSRRTNPDDPGLVHVTLDLAKTVKKIPATSNGAVR
jgi:acetyltransferase